MDESTALSLLSEIIDQAGDDAAIVNGHVLSIDMLHEQTDFPDGVTRYTAGWRSVGATLSDLAAMGADPMAAVAAYGAPRFEKEELVDFVTGARDVCEHVGAEYVGGDLDSHQEFTVATAAFGRVDHPVLRSGAGAGEIVFVTGELGRTAAAIDCFDRGDLDGGNELLRFEPRVFVGRTLPTVATAMIDSSDGLARSLHQLATSSDCGFAIDSSLLPVHPSLPADDARAWYFGEDFELVFTAPESALGDLERDVRITEIGRVTDEGVMMDGRPMPDRGYDHG